MTQQAQSGMLSHGVNNNSTVNMPLSQQTASFLQSAQPKYLKVWEGNLSGLRGGQPVFITRLEGYRRCSASETLSANWPSTMHIDRLISQDHMQDVVKADVLVFQALNQHWFLGQLQEKKLLAVIQLPSQTLLLYVSSKAGRLIGSLFPRDMALFKPQVPTQQQQLQQQQHPQMQEQHLQMQQEQLIYGPSTMIPTPGMTQLAQTGMSLPCVNNNSTANMPLSQQTSGSRQKEYVKVWEGNLSGLCQGQAVFITRLEGYRRSSSSETVAANWPSTMQIARIISQDHMDNKQYVGKADFLVFRAMNRHGFLGQLQEKKLCAVIELPSQTLLLSVSDKACRLLGWLLPGDMAAF